MAIVDLSVICPAFAETSKPYMRHNADVEDDWSQKNRVRCRKLGYKKQIRCYPNPGQYADKPRKMVSSGSGNVTELTFGWRRDNGRFCVGHNW